MIHVWIYREVPCLGPFLTGMLWNWQKSVRSSQFIPLLKPPSHGFCWVTDSLIAQILFGRITGQLTGDQEGVQQSCCCAFLIAASSHQSASATWVLGVDSLNCWCGQDGLALRQGSRLRGSCSRKHLSSRWHWQGKWTVLHVLKLSTLSKQQTQLNTLGAYLLTSAGVSGFNITDLGLQAPGKWTHLFLRHCLSSSVNISRGKGDQWKSS